MADQIVSWGGVVSKGTSGLGITGSLSLTGDLNFQPGATRYISMSASPTTASGNSIVIQAGDATSSGTGGSVSIQPGGGAGGPGAGTVTISNTSWWNGATVNGLLTVTNQGPNTGTALTVNAGAQIAMRFDWDNINLVTSAVSANRILRFTGASQYQVRGSGTTSSTTSLLVQNANASASLSVTDDRLVTVASKLQVGTFTPGAATGSSTIFTTGRISAGGGITVYTPAAGDDGNTGISFNSGLQIYSNNATVALFRAVGGGNSGFMFNVGGYGYNAPSGTGTVNTVLIDNPIVPTGTNSINYNYVTIAPSITQGSFGTGTIRGFYFAPSVASLNTSPLRAFESTRGDVIIGGNANVIITGSLFITGSVTITGSLLMPSGSNTRVGSDVLTAGSVSINNTTVTADSLIFVTPTSAGTLTGTLRIAAIVPGTSFTVSSTSITDTAAFSYFIVN